MSLGISTAEPFEDRRTVPSFLVSCADDKRSTEPSGPVGTEPNNSHACQRRRRHLRAKTRMHALLWWSGGARVSCTGPPRTSTTWQGSPRTALEAQVAFVSLLGSERQVFIGKKGSDADGIPREQSFCAHAIAGNGVLVVADAGSDPRFHDNPLVTVRWEFASMPEPPSSILRQGMVSVPFALSTLRRG